MQTCNCKNKQEKVFYDRNIYVQLAGKTSAVLNIKNIKISEQ